EGDPLLFVGSPDRLVASVGPSRAICYLLCAQRSRVFPDNRIILHTDCQPLYYLDKKISCGRKGGEYLNDP
ncbi:MAG TPA: hypothetical protein VN857_15275, partial [Chthoniobacterales bacterium]|nr:hypothetical protein [Chthoniobacterales bacterium]